jgi:Transglutaminase-like superfamily
MCNSTSSSRPLRQFKIALIVASFMAAMLVDFADSLIAAEPGNSPYPFKAEPLEVLSNLTGVPAVEVPAHFFTPSELALLHDTESGKLQSMSLAEALLLASGVTDNADRRSYMKRLDSLTAEARKITAGVKTTHERGRRLLQFLHDGPMAAGFESHQASLAHLLDTRHYNCVSSGALFAIIAQRLGMKVRMVQIPEHVYCEAYDGQKWVDVEPTNAHGFGVKPDRKLIETIKAKNGYADGSAAIADFRYPVDNLQMVAVVYFCHGSNLDKEDDLKDALAAKFFSLALDPNNPLAIKSLRREIDHWCEVLIAAHHNDVALDLAHQYEQSLKNPAKAKKLIAKASKSDSLADEATQKPAAATPARKFHGVQGS